MSTNHLSLVARARQRIGITPICLALLQAILLYLTTGAQIMLDTIYTCALPCGNSSGQIAKIIAALFGIAMFALPGLIGALSRTWRAAIVLAILPWWLVVIAHAGSLLTPYTGLSYARFDAPFWLIPNRLLPLLLSLAFFAALGWFGWLARRALAGE